MIKIFLIAVLSYVPVLGADVPFPQERLRTLPVLVRYDAHSFYDKTHQLFAMTERHFKNENAYKLLFKGIIFGQTFKTLTNTDDLLNVALTKLVTEDDFYHSRLFYKAATNIKHFTKVKKVGIATRRTERDEFKRAFGSTLDELYENGNVYALFIKGFLEYDEAVDSSTSVTTAIEKIERAADCLCLHAMRFGNWLNNFSSDNKYILKIDNITQGSSNYKAAYFDELGCIIELIKSPIDSHMPPSKTVSPTTLPVIDVLEKIKKSVNLINPIFERTYLPDETSYYGSMLSELMKISTDTRNSKPALGLWGKTAVIACPIIGTLGGIIGLCRGELAAILTTAASAPTLMYGIQKQLSTPPVSLVAAHCIDYEIDLISMYLTLKNGKRYAEDTQKASRVFNLGVNESRQDQFYRFMARTSLTLSQMILMEEGAL